ncbi:hypothetical protein [Arthrobacter sp. NEB 688]|uniref:hypothetical protein n=1 Tax=Arthrobacter sp. NEB 688 TaxID=904039 RepID=UPI0015679A6D|nr:hypothetical protein [Arthrobacter sp. NEB 688]QKE85301.1 hypothetical protein HL663_16050 [Arthrobacter sp. NEB 688]
MTDSRRAPSATLAAVAAVLLALVVVLGLLALVVGWVAVLVLDDGVSRWVWGLLGALLLWRLVPRPARVDRRALPTSRDEQPALHELVDAVSAEVGVAAPARVLVDTGAATRVHPTGYLGGAALVVALPEWTALDPGERVAALAHELRCSRVRRGPAGILVRVAGDVLSGARTILTPVKAVTADRKAVEQATSTMGYFGPGDEMAGNLMRRQASAAVGGAGMQVVAVPFRALHAVLDRAWRPTLHHAASEADRRAAALAGPAAVRGWLLAGVGVPRGATAAHNAAHTPGVDVFLAIEAAQRPTPAELRARLDAAPAAAVDLEHPPTRERVAALESGDVPVSDGWVERSTVTAAAVELFRMRAALGERYREELVHGRS